MIESTNHCRIVNDCLNGKRGVDEQVFGSLAVLGERLERLRNLHETFEEIGFSPDVEALKTKKAVAAVL